MSTLYRRQIARQVTRRHWRNLTIRWGAGVLTVACYGASLYAVWWLMAARASM